MNVEITKEQYDSLRKMMEPLDAAFAESEDGKPDPGEGRRLLDGDEVIKEGDEFLNFDGVWKPFEASIGSEVNKCIFDFCRRVVVEDEYDEWERDKDSPHEILFVECAGVKHCAEVCRHDTTRFGGFVFRKEGQPDYISMSPVLVDMGEDDCLTEGEYVTNVKGIVYADAVRMRRLIDG